MTSRSARRYGAQMEAQGYEAEPPQCANCKHYETRQRQRPGWPNRAQHCALGGFPVSGHGICDRWLGYDGATLA